MAKRKMALVLSAVMTASMLTVPVSAEESVTISSFDAHGYAIEEYDAMVAGFTEKTGIQVELQHAANDDATLLQSRLNSGNLPDAFNVQSGTQSAMYAEYAYDWSNDTEILDLFQPGTIDRCKDENGKIYGLPWAFENMGLLYNKDCFEKAGITELPVNMEELEAACEKLQDAGITPFAIAGSHTWVVSQLASHFIIDKSLDGEGTNEALLNGDVTVAELPNIDNLFKMLDLIKEYGDKKQLEYDWEMSESLFANGEAAMIEMGDWCQAMIDSFNPDANVGYMPMPVGETAEDCTVLSNCNWMYVVNKDSENLEAAKEYVKYVLTSDEGITWIAQSQCLVPAAKTDIEVKAMLANDCKQYIDSGVTTGWIHTIAPSDYGSIGGAAIQSYLLGDMTKEDVIAELQSVWDNAE